MVASVFKSFFFFPESLKTKTGIRRTHYCDVKCFVQSTLICIFTHSQLTNTWVTTETQCEAAAESGASQNESPSAAYKLWYVILSFKTEAGEKTSSSYGRSLKFIDVEMLRVSKLLGRKDGWELWELRELKANLINDGFCARTQSQRDSFHFLMNPLTHESEIRRASV